MSVYDTPAPGAFGADGYANASLAASTAYKNTLARINQKRAGTLKQFGYLGDINDDGALSNVRVDPNNAYGGLQSMLRQHANDFQAADFAAQDRGLHGGLAHKADSELAYQHGAESAQFGTGLVNTLGGYQDEQTQAALDRDRALYEAELAATRNAVDAQAFNQGDYTGLDYPDYGTDPVAAAGTSTAESAGRPAAKAQVPTKVAGKNIVVGKPTGYAPGGQTYVAPASKAATVAKKVVEKKQADAASAAKALAVRSAALNKKYGKG